jgi:hypothetical protein
MSAFPPHRSNAAIAVPQEIALKYLQAYISATKTSPYLLPNARIESSGPTSSSSTTGVVFHNINRLEAGLRGEWIAPSLDLDENAVKIATGLDEGGQADHMEVDGWQDLEEYQLEQEIEEGEVGPRDTAIAQEGDAVLEQETEVINFKPEKAPRPGKVVTKAIALNNLSDKERKKLEKKERHKEDKLERAKNKGEKSKSKLDG